MPAVRHEFRPHHPDIHGRILKSGPWRNDPSAYPGQSHRVPPPAPGRPFHPHVSLAHARRADSRKATVRPLSDQCRVSSSTDWSSVQSTA
ncbi:hypothetical protein GCM10009716_01350 [Streptomyces sodiiphilus]|uniref:Uncharacterized protein n=1 Tax=Streptomyces sodiiphilus TaxID=226217 RepID=A0ABN2NUK2_9ACTN